MGDVVPDRRPEYKRSEGFQVVPIGVVRSPYRNPEEAPSQGREGAVEATIEIDGAYRQGLEGLEGRDRVVVVCWLDRAPRDVLRVRPRRDPTAPLTGVFATRSPARPNPLAVYVARLLEVRGGTLRVTGLDALDGTPVVDLKPFVARLDE